jgi:hypothetical protein
VDLDDSPEAPPAEHLRLAGWALAHALGSVDGWGTLCTLAIVDHDGARQLVRYEAGSVAESIDAARVDLRSRLGPAGRAALVYDGYATLDRVRTDAMIVELIGPGPRTLASLLQPYRPGRFRPLALLRAIGIPLPGGVRVIGSPITESLLAPHSSDALTRGLAEHPYGRRMYGRSEPLARP